MTGVWLVRQLRSPGPWEEANGRDSEKRGHGQEMPTLQRRLQSNETAGWGAKERRTSRGLPQKVLEAFQIAEASTIRQRCCSPLGAAADRVCPGAVPDADHPDARCMLVTPYEYMNVFRVIPIDGQKHPDDILLQRYMGRFDRAAGTDRHAGGGCALGFNDKTWLSVERAPSTPEAFHITERYTRVSKDRIDYDVTHGRSHGADQAVEAAVVAHARQGTRLAGVRVCGE